MQTLADAVVLSTGWTRRLIAVAAGAFGALAMAPIGFAPALVVTMVVSVWLLDGASERRKPGRPGWPGLGSLRLAYGAGWWVGFGYFVGGLWWLGAAFLVDPQFTWALPLGVLGLPALLAIFTGIGFALARLLWSAGSARILAFGLGLGIAEWMRGHLFSGFPWNAFGMAMGTHIVSAQAAALIGLDGLTLLTVVLCAAPATLTDRPDARIAWRPTICAIGVLAVVVAFGTIRLAGGPVDDVAHVVVRIMQPGVVSDAAFIPENKDKIVDRYISLSQRDDRAKGVTLADVTMLVWPESAFPFILSRDPQELAKIGAFLPPHTSLVTGAAREEEAPGEEGRRGYSAYYNAIQVIASGGTIIDSYDKVHLVPFGEYLPFSALLRRLGLRNFVAVPGGFEPGTLRRSLTVPGLPAATPLVCYEAIFPGEVELTRATRRNRTGFLLNVTNDGWFGTTAGPSQHFAQARLRTIEEGLPMVRGAATGISAIIDPYGRIREQLALGTEGILDGRLPRSVPPPFFAKIGSTLIFTLWLMTLAAWLVARTLHPDKTLIANLPRTE